MNVAEEVEDLLNKAMYFTAVTDRETRWNGALWIEAQLKAIDDEHGITRRAEDDPVRIDLMATLRLVFDFCLYDKLEDSDWIETLPESYDGDIDQLVSNMRKGIA